MQEQTKRPVFGMPETTTIAKPKDLLSEVPDITAVLAPKKPKRVITRCAQCDDPYCRIAPVDIEVED